MTGKPRKTELELISKRPMEVGSTRAQSGVKIGRIRPSAGRFVFCGEAHLARDGQQRDVATSTGSGPVGAVARLLAESRADFAAVPARPIGAVGQHWCSAWSRTWRSSPAVPASARAAQSF